MHCWSWLFRRVPCVRRRVVVNLIGERDSAIRGVLYAHRGPWLVLKQAEYVPAKGDPLPMDGDVVIECARVAFIQVCS